ncbi:MAG: phosphodiesterase [Oscillospiraceae bacterium]|nr:phosphodiesterase [Oscillospiraceae bacterium]
MKLMFASDIHGSAYWTKKMTEVYRTENAERLVLLGDLLYHGPRNDLPRDYNPREVIEILNSMNNELLCVRGNCDTEVDQMVLDFPILADYAILYLDGRMVYITPGHIFNNENLPKINKGDILMNGHTHIQAIEDMGEYTYLNPGSVSIPKGGNRNSYMIYENGEFTIKELY